MRSASRPRFLVFVAFSLLALIVLHASALPALGDAVPPGRAFLPLIVHASATPSGVVVENSKSFVPFEGATYLYTVGSVKNHTGGSVRFVKITVTGRDAAGNVLGSNYAYAPVGVIPPGEAAPFRVIISDITGVSSTELKVDWSATTETWSLLEVSSVQTGWVLDNWFRVTGTVRNQYGVERKSVKVIVTMYDANDDVIGVDWSNAKPSTMPAGSEQSFEVEVAFWVGRPDVAAMARYTVVAGGE
jgi:hypothetical protein